MHRLLTIFKLVSVFAPNEVFSSGMGQCRTHQLERVKGTQNGYGHRQKLSGQRGNRHPEPYHGHCSWIRLNFEPNDGRRFARQTGNCFSIHSSLRLNSPPWNILEKTHKQAVGFANEQYDQFAAKRRLEAEHKAMAELNRTLYPQTEEGLKDPAYTIRGIQ